MVRVMVWITVSRRVTVTFNVFNKFKDCLSISKGAELSQPLPCSGRGDTAL